MRVLAVSAVLYILPVATASVLPRASWPNKPFTTSGRYMKDASGATVTYAGVNWPGAADTMLPEGLQYQSISNILSKIKSLGMNVIQLTYAIEMIDDIYDGGDVAMQTALTSALGATNGSKVYNQILTHNPSFSTKTTRLQVSRCLTHYTCCDPE